MKKRYNIKKIITMITLMVILIGSIKVLKGKDVIKNIDINNETSKTSKEINSDKEINIINRDGGTIAQRFGVPDGYERVEYAQNSFEQHLRERPLKKNKESVYYYDGKKKINDVHEAVFALDLGNKDLQQCADSIIRLRAEYLYEKKLYKDINFNFTNGFNAEYEKWMNGYRIIVSNNNVSWIKRAVYDDSYETFQKYLDIVYAYAGTLSLEKELVSVEDINDIKIGDVFIQGGSPGHAVIVVDLAINKQTGDKNFMLAQGYMPAQDIHILKNQNNIKNSPWYSIDFGSELKTPEWTFKKNSLKRFADIAVKSTNSIVKEDASINVKDTNIKIYKSERTLKLFEKDELVKEFKMALGNSPVGHKQVEGDMKTPEGEYYICTRNDKSNYTLFLGLSYPNKIDAKNGYEKNMITEQEYKDIVNKNDRRSLPNWNTALGGAVGIHGGGNIRDWTWGCVALTDEDIRFLWKNTKMGTKVLIYE